MRSIKTPPRFLPTLTEVIPPPAAVDSSLPAIDTDLLLDNVMQSLLPRLQVQLQETLEQMVQDQVRLLLPRLQQEVEAAVRQAVAQMQPD